METNNHADALASIKEVKAADVKNIYLIALEKQIAKLNDTTLPPENRSGIIKSLPAMIDRAISDIQRRASVPKVDETQKEQKEAALEKLKSQYFQRADDYVEKHEYQRALEEIRRIYIIEPGSVVAKEYEQKIEQLATLRTSGATEVAPTVEVKEAKKITPVVESPKEKGVVKEKQKKSQLPIIAAAAVVILAIGTWFIFLRGSKDTQADQTVKQQPSISLENETPTLPTTTTSTPQSGKESAPITETPRQPTKVQKTKPEVKPAPQETKAVQPSVTPPAKTPAITPPVRTQPQTTQPPPQQQPIQPVATTPPPQPVQQQPKVAESAPAPMPFVAIESPPEVIRREPAQYPEIAIKMGLQGKVFVEVTVDVQGKPIQAKVVKSSSDIFNEAATEAALKSTYKPAMMSTGPVTAKVTVPFDFRIKR